jgi:hypothetical protein
VTDEPAKHISEALGGSRREPVTADVRVERERVRNLVQSVAACYNSLAGQARESARRDELEQERDRYDRELRRVAVMSAAERRVVLAEYPELLARLRAQLDG